jgi:undecaprenyl diphosphate synthase
LPRNEGHRAGIEALREVVRAAAEFGVPMLTVYAFSTENWTRPRVEVQALMLLLKQAFAREAEALHRNGVCIRRVGSLKGVSKGLLDSITKAEALTRSNQRLVLNVAFNYGGRAEIIDAVQAIVRKGIAAEDIDEEAIRHHLWTGDVPDPDLIIRTGGDMRLSNFLIWQAAYAELYITPTYWPDFGRDALYQALLDYQSRDRRFGGLPTS